MDRDHYLAQLRVEGDRMLAAGRAGLDAPIPVVADWTVRTAIDHTGMVLRWASGIIANSPDKYSFRDVIKAPDGAGVLDWFAEGLAMAESTLGAVDLGAEVFTFVGTRPAAFWVRRCPLEVAIHRWDTETAHGTPAPIDRELAIDGIDELFEIYFPNRFDPAGFAGTGETVHLHTTDGDGEWMVTFGADGVTWEHGHGKGDVAVRGTASELYTWAWNRRDRDGLDVFGDESILDRWAAHVTF